MLKKSISIVLGSEVSSTGTLPPHISAARTDLVSLFVGPCVPEGRLPVSTRLQPCLGEGASRRARVWRVWHLGFLSTLRGIFFLSRMCGPVTVWLARMFFT